MKFWEWNWNSTSKKPTRWVFDDDLKIVILISTHNKWTSSWGYGTYHIGNQRGLRQACASAQSHQSLCCLHTWSIEVDKVQPTIRHLAPLDGCTCTFEEWVYGGRKVPYLMTWLINVFMENCRKLSWDYHQIPIFNTCFTDYYRFMIQEEVFSLEAQVSTCFYMSLGMNCLQPWHENLIWLARFIKARIWS